MAEQQCKILYDESQLSRECLMHSEQQLGETKTKRDETLRELISWMDSKPQLKVHVHNIVWLLYFLRATKFRIKEAKNKIRRLVCKVFCEMKNY